MLILGVMAGGALGALARYLTGLWLRGALVGTSYAGFPLATLSVNVLGSFLLSLLVNFGLLGASSPVARVAIGTGFIGALTTFSTFELESELLLREGQMSQALTYIVGNLVLGYLGILMGRWVATRLGANL